MISVSAVGRAGTLDEVATVAALLMGQDGAFITGSDFLIDGGVTFAYWYGELAPKKIIIILRSAEANIPTVRPARYKQLSLLCIRKLNNQYVCLQQKFRSYEI